MNTNVNVITDQLQKAETHADAAIEQTITYKIDIADVGHGVETSKSELQVVRQEGEELASSARFQLQRSKPEEKKPPKAKIDIEEAEIRQKTREVKKLKGCLAEPEPTVEAIRRAAKIAKKRGK